jgi:hypothetical protein
MINKPELKLCPFCGHKPHVEHFYNPETWGVECDFKGCLVNPATGTCYSTEKKAIEDWNRRK